jgi:hypothetical protein
MGNQDANKISELNDRKIRLCGVQGCCPTVDFGKPDIVTINDDFGGKVTLTRDQWAELKQVQDPQ